MLPREPLRVQRERQNKSSDRLKLRPSKLRKLLLKRRSKIKLRELPRKRKNWLRKLI
jgi:hypothetical protein